jgi:hypothetical protein
LVVFSHVEKVDLALKLHEFSVLAFGPPLANTVARRWPMTRTLTQTIFTVLLAGAVSTWAQQFPQQQQQPQQADDDGYAPEHGVARISVVDGDVSVQRGDSGEFTAAALNGPLVANDHLATGQNGRSEIQFDFGNMLRLGPSSEVRMGELADRHYLVQIAVGTTTFRVLRDSGADVEISTPTVSVRPAEEGSYRVTVFPDGTTEITVRAGRAEIFSPRGTETLSPGRTMEARGTPDDPEYMINAAIPQDEWDRWNVDRDSLLERSSSYQYVSPDVAGAEDLDAYGRWNNDPEYGSVWVPNVDPGWAPYRVGRWVDEDYYGWTWVSGDPWGWAPYHYGNWYMSSFGWAWYPGSRYGRHYWRPALVGFVGWGGGGGLGFGFGNVGWVPLAPHERFRPWYGRGFNNGFNIVNGRVDSNFRNARFVNGRSGLTSVNAGDFGRGRSVNTNNFVRASNTDLTRAGSVQGRLPFSPTAESRRMSDARVNTRSLPRVSNNVRFAQSGLQGNRGQGNRGPAQGQPNPGRTATEVRPAQSFGQSSGTRANGNSQPTGGWRRLDNGAVPNAARRNGAFSSGPAANGVVNNNPNDGRGRTFNGNTGRPNNAPAAVGERNNQRPAPAPQASPSPRQYIQRQNAPQQSVRISPPIVRERVPSPQVSRPEPFRGGFGTPRPQNNGGGGGARPSNGGGGGNRGGGGGGGGRGRW